jgi:hypothetical protein
VPADGKETPADAEVVIEPQDLGPIHVPSHFAQLSAIPGSQPA